MISHKKENQNDKYDLYKGKEIDNQKDIIRHEAEYTLND
tara:strand:+ start:22434 stop:22550 length:117 start_codon:yes stop_codon:yes gene_type:complete